MDTVISILTPTNLGEELVCSLHLSFLLVPLQSMSFSFLSPKILHPHLTPFPKPFFPLDPHSTI